MALRTQTRALTRYTRAGMRTVRAERANCICRTVRRSSSDHKSAAQNSGTNAWVARDGLPCMRRRTAEPNTRVAAAALESTRSSACSSRSAEVEVVEQPATAVEPCSSLLVAGEDLNADSYRRSSLRRTCHAPLGVSDRRGAVSAHSGQRTPVRVVCAAMREESLVARDPSYRAVGICRGAIVACRRFFFVGVVRRCFLSGRRVTGVHGWRVSLGMSWDGRVHVRVSSNRMELASGCALYV